MYTMNRIKGENQCIFILLAMFLTPFYYIKLNGSEWAYQEEGGKKKILSLPITSYVTRRLRGVPPPSYSRFAGCALSRHHQQQQHLARHSRQPEQVPTSLSVDVHPAGRRSHQPRAQLNPRVWPRCVFSSSP